MATANSDSDLEQFFDTHEHPVDESEQDTEDLLNKLNGNLKAFKVDDEIASKVDRQQIEDDMNDEERNEWRRLANETKLVGNEAFLFGDFDRAVEMYTKSLDQCPLVFRSDRAIYFSNRAVASIKTSSFDSAISDCSSALDLGAVNTKPLFRRAQCYERKSDTWDKALEDYKSLLTLEPDNMTARQAIIRLPVQIVERNERTKEEMLGKLKDLGNTFLRPFGMSTDNFSLEKGENGGYSISMRK